MNPVALGKARVAEPGIVTLRSTLVHKISSLLIAISRGAATATLHTTRNQHVASRGLPSPWHRAAATFHRTYPFQSFQNVFLFYFSQFFNGPFRPAWPGLPKQQLPRHKDVGVGQPDLARNDALELRL